MSYAYSLTANRDDAEDLVQETLLKALKYSDKFIYESSLKAWTYTIMKNTFINDYRRMLRQNSICNQKEQESFLNYIHASDSDKPDSVYASKELEKTIRKLDSKVKLPFKMHHEGFKYNEIAKTLDINLGTVKSRIFFARKKLMEQLTEYVN